MTTMLEYIYFFFFVVMGLSSLLIKKQNNGLALISFMLMTYIFAFNTDNNDYDAYYSFYNGLKWGVMDYITGDAETSPLFTYSGMLIKSIGFDFNFYRLLMFCSFMFLFQRTFARRATIGVLLASYGIVVFFFDLVQLRFTFAQFLFLIGVYFLSFGRRWWFVAMTIVASLFHTMMLPFLIFAFVPFKEENQAKIIKIMPYVVVGVVVASVAGKAVIVKLQHMVAYISMFDEYASKMEQTVNYGYLLYVFYQTVNIWVARDLYRHPKLLGNTSYSFSREFIRMNYMVQIIGFLFVIPAMININFSRYMRVLFLVNMIAYSVYYYAARNNLFTGNTRLRFRLILDFIGINFTWIVIESYANGAYGTIRQFVFASL